MSNPAPITLAQLFRFYRGLPHQSAAITQLERDLLVNGYEVAMRRDREWFHVWSQDGKQPETEPAPAPERPGSVLLKVPYFQQNDNASGTGYRECFSSSMAMVAAYHGKLTGGDDAYNRIRAPFGDTTNAQAQISALRKLGLDARLVTNAAPGLLESEIRAGRPVAVGWLHRGPISKPTGGGHWSVVIGFDPENWVHHDPNGEADMIRGGYVNHSGGREVHYSRRNWERRWEADGPSTGWAMLIRPA
jgi:hypothetical protein